MKIKVTIEDQRYEFALKSEDVQEEAILGLIHPNQTANITKKDKSLVFVIDNSLEREAWNFKAVDKIRG